jgi:predicted metal-dependent phosphoesterase TrpH
MGMRLASPLARFAIAFALVGQSARADQTLVLDGSAPAGAPDHFFVPFQVPAGTAEIEVLHESVSDKNTLDFGLVDPAGYRGWGGGTSEHAIVGTLAASRAYVPGAITAGQWKVVVGKASIGETPARYHIVVTLRNVPTLAPQTNRKPYAPAAPLKSAARYYAADFHVHSDQSTDAKPSLDTIATYAETHGIDVVEVSDHNTITQLDYFVDAQKRHPNVLLVPGYEYTTYAGHGNAIGATKWTDHKIGQPGVAINSAVTSIRSQGALFAINHPVAPESLPVVGQICIGCKWKQPLDPALVSAMEIMTGGRRQQGFAFQSGTMEFWEKLLASGAHIAAISGSDDHKGAVDEAFYQSPIGNPVTMVFAKELSVQGILDGIRNGKTVVKVQDTDDPMIEFASTPAAATDTLKPDSLALKEVTLRAKVTGKKGTDTVVRFVKNGTALASANVTSDPFTKDFVVKVPYSTEDRYRVEVLVGGTLTTITSHVYIAPYSPQVPPEGADAGASSGSTGGSSGGGASASGGAATAPSEGGCGCSSASGMTGSGVLLVLCALLRRKRATQP